jgi:hypothetical protein
MNEAGAANYAPHPGIHHFPKIYVSENDPQITAVIIPCRVLGELLVTSRESRDLAGDRGRLVL